ncbi:murein transglycosylase A [Sphingomonas naphthae]|uniref:peptidoglycan lytic exotransglycosylase n=2 Tax=Sphingomonas naphthae TaxID=1813468 RepID=A0ABY7TR70_9SPHN|nr:murein transglycosylase A [Sphingomonas naphthae]WCT75501.1 murein transglycosylase A [Sphingomonas naphthae]
MPDAPKPPATAAELGVAAGPALGRLPRADAALTAFKLSCPGLIRRTDRSGLTRGEDWRAPCDAAKAWTGDAAGFFAANLEPVIVGPGQAFATGYYEPEIAGSRSRAAGYQVPVYRRPPDLIEADLGLFTDSLKGRKVRGRIEGKAFVPYADRAAIEDGALAGQGLEIAWAADPVEMFFLEVQGSGRLRLPDGGVMRIGYDSQNGRDYTGIGKLMRDRGLLGPGQASMQGIMAYLRAHPEEGRAIMRENRSFVFFRELTGAGPLGAMGVAVTGQTSVATDPAFVPLGAPVLLEMDRPEASGLWVAQDTGGAIKGANRFDTFWGAGDEARRIAGGMSAKGRATLLLPRGTVARLKALPHGTDGAQRP